MRALVAALDKEMEKVEGMTAFEALLRMDKDVLFTILTTNY